MMGYGGMKTEFDYLGNRYVRLIDGSFMCLENLEKYTYDKLPKRDLRNKDIITGGNNGINCKNCGAPVKMFGQKCEFCGTQMFCEIRHIEWNFYHTKGWCEMRKADRIPTFLDELQKYWGKVPDWRFGQLIVNVLGTWERDPFFYEENEMLEIFEKFFREPRY